MAESVILVVEDDQLQAELVARALHKLAAKVIHANTGTQGWQIIQELVATVVLLDLALPEMSGIDVANIIRQDGRFADMILVAMTASNLSEQDFHEVRTLFNVFIEKPFHMEDLRQLVEGLL